MKLYVFEDGRLVAIRHSPNVAPLREVCEHFASGYRRLGWQNVTVEYVSGERASVRLTRPVDGRVAFREGRLEIYQEKNQ